MALFSHFKLLNFKLLNFKRFCRPATTERCLFHCHGDTVRRVEIGEHIINIQHATINALRLAEIRITVICKKIDVNALLPRLGTHARRGVRANDR